MQVAFNSGEKGQETDYPPEPPESDTALLTPSS